MAEKHPDREDRLKAALRANLRKRKEQQRDRLEPARPAPSDPPDPER